MALRSFVILAIYLIVFIGSIFYLGGTTSSSYFVGSTTPNCSLRNRHIGLFTQCVNYISATTSGSVTIFAEHKTCAYHSTLNKDAKSSQITWGLWFTLFLLLSLSIIITVVVWMTHRITIARRLSLLTLLLAFITFILLIVNYAVLTSAVTRTKFLMAKKCGYGVGFTIATIGFVISILGILPLIGILALAGIKGLKP